LKKKEQPNEENTFECLGGGSVDGTVLGAVIG